MSVIIHVGPPKSGTSSFQSALWRCSNLKTLNAFYPIDIDLNELSKLLFDRNDLGLEKLSLIYNEYLESKQQTLILSAEGFSDLGYINFDLYNQSVEYFCRLNKVFGNEEVILLYTLPDNDYSRMESQVIEAIKHGKSFCSQSIFQYIKSIPYFSSQRLFENVSRIIRPNKTIILKLNSFDCIFNKTADLFGLNFKSLSSFPLKNESPSPSLMYVQHCINVHLYNVTKECQEDKLREVDGKSIDFISKMNGFVINNPGLLDFLNITSRHELFSHIDPKYIDEQPDLVEYIEKFRRDTYFFWKILPN
jgi:hypothetical protein